MDLSYESRWWNQGVMTVTGVDEVGRGCLAGPVVAAAVVFDPTHIPIPKVNDSKQVDKQTRELLAIQIKTQAKAVGIGQVEATEIDTIGIVAAISKAMKQAVTHVKPQVLFVDGPLTLGLNLVCSQVFPIIRGDGLVYSIAAASIVAKVYRDSLMRQLAVQYPDYGWDTNVGYGTKLHLETIRSHGLTPHHRRSFVHVS